MKRILLLSLPLILLLSLSAFAQDAQQNLTLVVAGQPGQAPIVQINGKSYVDINALARLTHSSVSIKGNRIILTPLGSAPSAPPANPEPSASAGQLKLVAERQPVDPEPSEPAAQAKPAATEKKPAQDTPVDPAGTSVATHETPAAAANAEELRKAAQNPIA